MAILREHLETYGTAPDGRLFVAACGGRVRSTEYAEVWQEPRKKALSTEDAASPLAEVPYSLRHAGVSLWIKAGVDPVEVARRAGHSIAVLWKFHAKILRGQEHQANQFIDDVRGSLRMPAPRRARRPRILAHNASFPPTLASSKPHGREVRQQTQPEKAWPSRVMMADSLGALARINMHRWTEVPLPPRQRSGQCALL